MPSCDHCDAAFDDEDALLRHMRDHWDDLTSHEQDEVTAAERRREQADAAQQERLARRKKRLGYGLAAALVLAVLGLAAVQVVDISRTPTGGGPVTDANLSGQPVRGDPDAPVTVVEFGDYKCPFCRQFTTQVEPALAQQYIDDGTAKLVFINFPFLAPDSTTAAVAGECVYRQDADKFWDFHHALYRAQGPESERWATPDRLMQIARSSTTGLDYGALRTCITQQQTMDAVRRDRALAESFSVSATPAVYVDGQPVDDWRIGNLGDAIDRAAP